jgi:hypothetical protein
MGKIFTSYSSDQELTLRIYSAEKLKKIKHQKTINWLINGHNKQIVLK